MTDTTLALEPCPFCGNRRVDILHYAESIASCSKCGADGPRAKGAKGKDGRVRLATRLWNTRAARAAPAPELREALELIAHEADQYADGAEDAHYLAKEMLRLHSIARDALENPKVRKV